MLKIYNMVFVLLVSMDFKQALKNYAFNQMPSTEELRQKSAIKGLRIYCDGHLEIITIPMVEGLPNVRGATNGKCSEVNTWGGWPIQGWDSHWRLVVTAYCNDSFQGTQPNKFIASVNQAAFGEQQSALAEDVTLVFTIDDKTLSTDEVYFVDWDTLVTDSEQFAALLIIFMRDACAIGAQFQYGLISSNPQPDESIVARLRTKLSS